MAKGIIKLRQDICKACELCVSVCPKGVLALDPVNFNKKSYHPITVVKPDECIACASCAIVCPDGVINIYEAD